MKQRIVLIVSGGCIQCAYASDPDNVYIEVIDHDNMEADGVSPADADAFEREQIISLSEVPALNVEPGCDE